MTTPDPQTLTVPALLELLEDVRRQRHLLLVAEGDRARFDELIAEHKLEPLLELRTSAHLTPGQAFVMRPPRTIPMPPPVIELELELEPECTLGTDCDDTLCDHGRVTR